MTYGFPLKVGDYVRLTGDGWNSQDYGQSQGRIVRVDEVNDGQAWSNACLNNDPNYDQYGSLTDHTGEPYDDAYRVERYYPDGENQNQNPITDEYTLTTATPVPQNIKVYWEENVPLDKPENFLVLGLETTQANVFLTRANLDDLITVLQYAKTRIDEHNGN